MINFDDDKICKAIKKKKFASNSAYLIFAVLLICAVVSAVLTRDALTNGKNQIAHISALCLTAAVLLALIAVIIFDVAPANRALTLCVCAALANGITARKDMLGGDGVIEFSVGYSGNVLTLSRNGFTGADIELDLTPLKAAPALYATVGTKLWQFLSAYYFLHGKASGVKSVTVTDNMGKTPLTLTVFSADAAFKGAEKNYFIKKGLIK